MLRMWLAAGLAGAVLAGSWHPSAHANPLEDTAKALWSAATTATGGKSKRPAKRSSRKTATRANEPVPPLPVRKKTATGTKKATPESKNAATETEADTKQAATPAPPPDVWTPEEIAAAQARCTAVLKTINVEVIPQEPFKKGKCGNAAPVRLVSVGKTSKVRFSPPALVGCGMVAALSKWIVDDVQPLAKKHLGAPIKTVGVMSDYSCRTSFGRVRNRLSEHAYANALDIRGFVSAKGRPMHVLAEWGLTQRDINKYAAAAKAETKMARVQATRKGKTGKGSLVQKVAVNVPRGTATTSGSNSPSKDDEALADPNSALSRKAARTARIEAISLQVPSAAATKESKFLREAHAAACRIFGTTLGPEANEAHRNHFHVDMAERKYKKICD